MNDQLGNQPIWHYEPVREEGGCRHAAPPASRSRGAERPQLTEQLRRQVCVRVVDALLALDEGRCDEMDTHLRWMGVLCLLWGGDGYLEPLMPEVNRLRAANGLGPA